MKSVELVIKGRKVIDIGYRPYLLLNAMYRDIQKIFAFNAREEGKETVIIRLQGEDSSITQYIDFIQSNFPEHAEVEEVIERSFEGHVMDADKFLQLLQFEQINKAVPAIISIDKKQDIMIGKQDSTISILKGVKEDASDALYEKYEQLSKEITEIKATLSEIKAKVA
ncbi:Uncharacterised protein [uncultured archaeon]|nr:Uncharacterised protein [uncultured archaeon]